MRRVFSRIVARYVCRAPCRTISARYCAQKNKYFTLWIDRGIIKWISCMGGMSGAVQSEKKISDWAKKINFIGRHIMKRTWLITGVLSGFWYEGTKILLERSDAVIGTVRKRAWTFLHTTEEAEPDIFFTILYAFSRCCAYFWSINKNLPKLYRFHAVQGFNALNAQII